MLMLHHLRQARGFTLLEMLLTITILATLAAVAVPMMADTNRVRVRAAVDVLISDLELAQVMNISYPDDPVIVRFDTARSRYWIADADTPTTPINREDTGEPYLVTLGSGRASVAQGVTLQIQDMTANTVEFNSQGGLTDFNAAPIMTLSLNGEIVSLSIVATTGTIFETTVPEDHLPEGGGGKEEVTMD